MNFSGISPFARVAIPSGVEGTFTYRIPESLRDDVRRGMRVEVPWGTKLITGFVTELVDDAGVEAKKLKNIRAVLDDDEPALLPEIISLCEWAASYYLVPLGEMLRSALPANMSVRGQETVSVHAPEGAIERALDERRILHADLGLIDLIRSGVKDPQKLIEHQKGGRAALRRLKDAELVVSAEKLRDAGGVRFDRFVLLTGVEPGDLPPKQREVVDLLREAGGSISFAALTDRGASASSISTLARNEIVRFERRARKHTLDAFFADLTTDAVGDLEYSHEQRDSINDIIATLGTFAPFLLEGVTGSGKTEVYIEAMREVVRRGGQAIVLVPEISLTPILAARLKERFGDRIAILHSALSPSERYDQWWRARRGMVDVAVGPRSALFTPFPRLGIIIVDEEGDSAYKQEEMPRYNARDLAVVRAQLQNVPVVLGSATPSLESRENAARGKYKLLKLTRRVESRPLPEVEVIDIRGEKGEREDRGLVMFSSRLRDELQRVFDAGEQAIILMNRRGYAPFLLCRECENDFRCRDCSVTLTVHRRSNLLICHYCGYRKPIPTKCPACGGEVLQPIGFGTEKVEERFRTYFPDVTVDVLDRDSIRKKGELVRILERFRRRKTQALIGTQMLSKGHHFPNVTMTAVINADAILGFPDFRSAEKTFYLLTQVAGRSGRGELPGRVVIQSAFPNHYAIQHAVRHDFEGFFESEIEFRKRFRYPPISGMIAILFRSEDLAKVEQIASQVGARLEAAVRPISDVRVQGPAPAPLARIKGVYRFQILVRSKQRAALRRAVQDALSQVQRGGVDIVVDVDPINIL